MCAKDAAMCAKGAAMSTKDAAMCAKDAEWKFRGCAAKLGLGQKCPNQILIGTKMSQSKFGRRPWAPKDRSGRREVRYSRDEGRQS